MIKNLCEGLKKRSSEILADENIFPKVWKIFPKSEILRK